MRPKQFGKQFSFGAKWARPWYASLTMEALIGRLKSLPRPEQRCCKSLSADMARRAGQRCRESHRTFNGFCSAQRTAAIGWTRRNWNNGSEKLPKQPTSFLGTDSVDLRHENI